MSIYLPSLIDKFKDFVNGIKANWQEYEAHVDNTTDAHGIDDHFDATAADNVHGLAGKVVEESGSNDYGNWIRFANGWQICTATVDYNFEPTAAQLFPFPQPFASVSSVYWVGISFHPYMTYTKERAEAASTTIAAVDAADKWYVRTRTNNIQYVSSIRLIAVGKWK